MKNSKTQFGFTLIEVIIYLGLFTFLIVSSILAAYSLMSSSAKNQSTAMILEEGSFILGKIDWALSSASEAEVTLNGTKLKITKFDGSVIYFIINTASGNISIQRGLSEAQDLNNSNVSITCQNGWCFSRTIATGDGIKPEKVEVGFTLNALASDGRPISHEFSTVKFIRK